MHVASFCTVYHAISVSYTHLDVYKRQILLISFLLAMGILNIVMRKDVYKRQAGNCAGGSRGGKGAIYRF